MKRVEANGNWSLFCPNDAAGMHEVSGEEFETYERRGRARKKNFCSETLVRNLGGPKKRQVVPS